MFAPSDEIFDQLSRALYRAGLFVSRADDGEGDRNSDLKELQSMSVLMHVMREQHKDSVAIQEIVNRVHNHIRDQGNPTEISEEQYSSLCKDLDRAPEDLKHAVTLAVDNLDKDEARLYSDMVIAFGASVAQAHFEGNEASLWERFLVMINDVMEDSISKYLYESNDMFDQMKISAQEASALDKLSVSVAQVWFEKFPEDSETSAAV